MQDGESPLEWLTNLAKKTERDIREFDFSALDLDVKMEQISQKAASIVKSEATGQVSYGVLAGYATGFVLKRVTRVGVSSL